MGLTIHYELMTSGQATHARRLVNALHQCAQDLPFESVGDVLEFRGDECDYRKRDQNDPHRWLLIQANTSLKLPKRRGERFDSEMTVLPLHVIAFTTAPGAGCEPANFGLSLFPRKVSHPEFGRLDVKLRDWSWRSCCKTHYASDPRCGGVPHFLKCHLSVIALLDAAKKLRCLKKVSDEGDFCEKRDLKLLVKKIGEQSAMVAGMLGVLEDAWGGASGSGTIESPIKGYPNFEHLEAEGQKHLPALLKALAQLDRPGHEGARRKDAR